MTLWGYEQTGGLLNSRLRIAALASLAMAGALTVPGPPAAQVSDNVITTTAGTVTAGKFLGNHALRQTTALQAAPEFVIFSLRSYGVSGVCGIGGSAVAFRWEGAMKRIRVAVLGVMVGFVWGFGSALAAPSKGFQWIPQWGVYAGNDERFWHAGVQWKLHDGSWVRLEAGHWVPDPYPPAVIVAIPKDRAHCPPGLAKEGCIPPGQQKKGGGPPGHRKKGY